MYLKRQDLDVVRKNILDISYTDWKKQSFSKGMLHQLKQKVKANDLLLSISILGRGWRIGTTRLQESKSKFTILPLNYQI